MGPTTCETKKICAYTNGNHEALSSTATASPSLQDLSGHPAVAWRA